MPDDITQSLDLVQRAQQGDAQAMNRLCERYYDRVRRIVRVRLGSKLRESVDSCDIVQETFMAAVRALSNFELREGASLINWLSRIAEHQIIAQADFHGAKKRDHDRVERLTSTSARSSTASVANVHVDDHTSPPDAVAREEEKRRLERCLAKLSGEYRELRHRLSWTASPVSSMRRANDSIHLRGSAKSSFASGWYERRARP